jgi:hypothetical protein
VAIGQEEPRQAAADTAVRAWSLLWLVAVGFGVAVVAAIAATKSGSLPALPAKFALGLTIALLFATSLAAVGRDGRVARTYPRAPADDAPEDEDDVRGSSEIERVYSWRQSRLAALGVTREAAMLLAADTRLDVHELERLLAAGCPLATALRILQPA